MTIAVIGCGYVGLVTGACFASRGHRVVCIDTDRLKIAQLLDGRVPVYEPGLDQMIQQSMVDGRLTFTADYAQGVPQAELVFITVGTPPSGSDGQIDLTYVAEAASGVAEHMERDTVVVIKSTVPVGTGENIAQQLRRSRPELNSMVVSNPEFLREGSAVTDFLEPDRIVVGVEAAEAREVMLNLYRMTVGQSVPIVFTRRRTAELIKYAANAFLVTKISFINEIADLCESIDADISDVALGIGLDPRIGQAFLKPGPGYGGSCFPKDARALLATARAHGRPLGIIDAAVAVNETRKHAMVRKIADACGGAVAGKVLGVLGLAFKPGTDDLRESPALAIIRLLVSEGAEIKAFDPLCLHRRDALPGEVSVAETAFACAQDADALVILTDWPEFAQLDLDRIKQSMRYPAVVDLRNVLAAERAVAAGLHYTSIGRRPEAPCTTTRTAAAAE